jgi:hypothetical protein
MIVEELAEVAAAMNERDSDHWAAGIGRRAESIACEHAETTGIGGKGWRKGDLHGKVRNGSAGEVWCDGAELVKKAQVVFPFLIRSATNKAASRLPGVKLSDRRSR